MKALQDVSALQEIYVQCRSYGHSWDEYAPIEIRSKLAHWMIFLRCTRCMTTCHVTLSLFGSPIRRYYEYPEGYRLAGYKKSDFKMELLRRRRAQSSKRKARA